MFLLWWSRVSAVCDFSSPTNRRPVAFSAYASAPPTGFPSPPIPSLAVPAKVQAAVAPGGSFAKLTLPELKAYLKSIKQPVGGKKGDLEERVRAALGGGGGGGAAAASAAAAGQA